MKTIIKIALLLFFSWHLFIMFIHNASNLYTYHDDRIKLNDVARQTFEWCDDHLQFDFDVSPSFQRTVYIYSQLTGANTGYGFFSPNVPSEVSVFFELKDKNDHPMVRPIILHSKYGMKRFIAALSSFRNNEKLKPIIARAWAVRMLEQFPQSNTVTVYSGTVYLPTMSDFRKGKRQKFVETSRYKFQLNI